MYILRLTYDRSVTTREANTGLIRHAIKEFNWERAFSNTSVNEKVDIFNKTILNILSNFISNEKKKEKKSEVLIQTKPVVMTTSVYVCLKYVVIPFVNL